MNLTKRLVSVCSYWVLCIYGSLILLLLQLKGRVYKGIPDRWRGEIWKKLLYVDDVKSDETYDIMKERARQTSPDIRQIDLDVNRTYRNHIMFRERYNTK